MLTIPSIVLYPRGGTLSWLCAMTFSSFRGFWYSPTSIRLHPPKPGTHQPKVGLNLHIALCLSALTESEPHVRMGAQAGCHCHNRSGKGVPSADFAGYILRAVAVRLGSPTNLKLGVPRHSAKYYRSFLTRLAESLLPPSRIYRSLFRGPGVRKLAACRFVAGTGLAAHWCVDIQFSSCYPIKGHYHNSTERKFCQGHWRNFVRLHKCSIFEVGPQCALRTSTWNTLLLLFPLLIKNWERHFDNLFHTTFTLICRVV